MTYVQNCRTAIACDAPVPAGALSIRPPRSLSAARPAPLPPPSRAQSAHPAEYARAVYGAASLGALAWNRREVFPDGRTQVEWRLLPHRLCRGRVRARMADVLNFPNGSSEKLARC